MKLKQILVTGACACLVCAGLAGCSGNSAATTDTEVQPTTSTATVFIGDDVDKADVIDHAREAIELQDDAFDMGGTEPIITVVTGEDGSVFYEANFIGNGEQAFVVLNSDMTVCAMDIDYENIIPYATSYVDAMANGTAAEMA